MRKTLELIDRLNREQLYLEDLARDHVLEKEECVGEN